MTAISWSLECHAVAPASPAPVFSTSVRNVASMKTPNAPRMTMANSAASGSFCRNCRIASFAFVRRRSVQHGDADEVPLAVAIDVDADERGAVDDRVDGGGRGAAALEHALQRGAVVDAGEEAVAFVARIAMPEAMIVGAILADDRGRGGE